MRIGVAGIGNMGSNHLRVLSMMKDAELAAVCDAKPELEGLARKYGARFYKTLAKMLARERLDAVDICLPTMLHESAALEALAAGKNVFVEKPIAHTLEAARRVTAAAEKSGLTLMVGHVERFNQAVRTLKEALAGERIVSISFTRVGPVPPQTRDVGVVLDIGIHDIDLARYISGREIRKVFCTTSGDRALEDCAEILMVLDDGISAQLSLNWLTPFKVRTIEAITRAKAYSADLMRNEVRAYGNFRQERTPSYSTDMLPLRYTEPLFAELLHFTECVRSGKKPLVNGREATAALRVAFAALKSAGSGKLVEIGRGAD
ncbi:MAG: Gfo/Idh/MocA family oxidoreductase [Candidatus Micrarchaeota archaeon]